MPPSLEFEEKNVEMAVKKACKELNIPREKLKHDVISYGSTGIFGLVGTKKARIRVTVPEPAPASVHKDSDSEKNRGGFPDHLIDDKDSQIDVAPEKKEILHSDDDPKDIGRDALQRIIDLITTDATISIEERQYIIGKIVNKSRQERIRIQVDVEGYLEKRRISLEGLASRLAEKVKRTGKPATIGQMNSHDRRIVHIALKNNSLVRTQSMGEGALRKLVIFPRKNSQRKKRH
ncbi:MAG: Jag N-terminal domain-containing protein [Deltaproteobacteria bacterium]|nr:Jag N-terminal domain-containing protein [Deltaproteobacteria bacterium]